MASGYSVQLVPMTLVGSGTADQIAATRVIFEATPTFSEDGAVEYEGVSPIHTPGAVQVYKRTPSRTFTIGAKLVSRNVADALRNMKYLQLLRSWRYPFFGLSGQIDPNTPSDTSDRNVASVEIGEDGSETTNSQAKQQVRGSSVRMLGAPPEVLYLYAYNNTSLDERVDGNYFSPVNISRLPVVMSNLSIQHPPDVDYIPVYQSIAEAQANPQSVQQFARRIDVSISLIETHSPREYERFSLEQYKRGNLVNF